MEKDGKPETITLEGPVTTLRGMFSGDVIRVVHTNGIHVNDRWTLAIWDRDLAVLRHL